MSDVFVSYSRRDIELVSRLCDGLRSRGKTVFVDLGELVLPQAPAPAAAGTEPAEANAEAAGPADERARAEISGIPPSAPWMDEIRAAIASADSIIVAISPDSCVSAVCRTELDYAIELSKRLIPVIVRETPAELVPAALGTLNWLPVDAGPSFDSDVGRLAEVLDTDVAGLHVHTRLTLRSGEWALSGNDRSLLLRGQELGAAEKWLAVQSARKPAPTSAQTTYIVVSRAAATRRQRGSVAIGLALSLVLAGLSVFAGLQWRAAVVERGDAIAQRDVAVSRALAAESGDALEADPQLGLLLALRAYDSAPTTQAESAVRLAAGANSVRGYLNMPSSAAANDDTSCPSNSASPGAFDPSGQFTVVTCAGYVEVWRWATRHGPGSAASPYAVHPGGSPTGAVFNRAGTAVLFAAADGRIYQWNWRSSSRVRDVGGPFDHPVLFPASSGTLVASEDGRTIAVSNLNSAPAAAMSVPCCFVNDALSPAIVFSPDGAYAATLTSPTNSSQTGTISVFDVSTGSRVFSRSIVGATLPLAVSSQGRIAVAVGGSAEVFSIAAPSQAPVVHDLTSPAGSPAHCCDVDVPLSLAWTLNGQGLAAASEDFMMRVWLGSSASPIYLADSDATGLGGVAFSPDGQYLLTSGSGVSQVWQWAAASPIYVAASGSVEGTAVSPDGDTFAVAESDNTILLWNWRADEVRTLAISDSHGNAGNRNSVQLAFSPSGNALASAGPDDYLRFWSVSSLAQTSETKLPGTAVSIAFSPGGNYFGVADVGGVTRWNTKGTPVRLITPQPANDGGQILSLSNTGAMQMLTFPALKSSSFNGDLVNLAAGSDKATTVAPVLLPQVPDTAATLLPGHRLVLCGEVCFIYSIGAHSLKSLKAPALTDADGVSLTTDQQILYLTSEGGTISAWDLKLTDPAIDVSNTSAVVPGIQAGATANYVLASYNSDNSANYTLELLPTVQDSTFADVLKIARSDVIRPLTALEQRQYLAGTRAG